MKIINLPLALLIFTFISFQSYSQKKINSKSDKSNYSPPDLHKINGDLLGTIDDIIYFNNKPYTGLFYQIGSSDGSTGTLKDTYCDGEYLKGKRHGIWRWYRNGNLQEKRWFENGKDITNQFIKNPDLYPGEDIKKHNFMD